MALTIRDIDQETRDVLDNIKHLYEIKTDSKAFIQAVKDHAQFRESMIENVETISNLRDQVENYERILSGLEKYLAPALEAIRQQELDL